MSVSEAPLVRQRSRWVAAPGGTLPIAVPLAVLVLAHGTFLYLGAGQVWALAHYQFFPILLAGVAALFWSRFRQAGPLCPGGRAGSMGLIVLSWGLLATALMILSPRLGTVAAMVTLLGLIHEVGGGPLLRRLLPVWLLLWLAVPPPLNVDGQLIAMLQALASRISSKALQLLGVFHYMEGNVVVVAGKRYLVEEACSGVRSMFAVLACVFVYAVGARVSWWRTILLVVASVGWVILANVVRIVAVTYAGVAWKVDLSEGWRHESLGFLALIVAVLLILSTDQTLRFLEIVGRKAVSVVRHWARRRRARWNALWEPSKVAAPPRETVPVAVAMERPAQEPGGSAAPEPRRSVLFSPSVLGVYGALAVAQACLLWPFVFRSAATASQTTTAFEATGEGLLPEEWGPFRGRDFQVTHREHNDQLGDVSRVWAYQWAPGTASVSVHYPFDWKWHEVSGCYEKRGWRLLHREVLPAGTGEAANLGAAVKATFINSQGQHGCLFFGFYSQEGIPLDPVPDLSELSWLKYRLTVTFLGSNRPKALQMFQTCYQVQMFLESDAALTPEQEREARAFFEESRRVIHRAGQGGREAKS